METSKGVKCLLSTDEAYYTARRPSEIKAAIGAGSNGKLWPDLLKNMEDLKKQGRTVIFWGEDPLKADDSSALPSHFGKPVNTMDMSLLFTTHGIGPLYLYINPRRRTVFPNYYRIQNKDTVDRNTSLIPPAE